MLHWVPSHTEETVRGHLPNKGNYEADKLAETARRLCSSASTGQQTIVIRTKVQKAISACLQRLEKIFRSDKEENSDGPSTDDFACDASQEPPNVSCDIK